ncbi:MAG: hypothetical protein ACTSQ5_01495 [Promethearchaeota archaeon]
MSKTNKIIGMTIIGLIFISLTSSSLTFSVANKIQGEDEDPEFEIDTDPDEIDEDKKRESERVVTIENSSNSAQIKSILKYSDQKDDITMDISSLKYFYIKGLYKSHTLFTQINLEFQITVYSIVEFEDENGNGIYEPDIDQEIQEMVLDSWQDISYVNLSAHIFTINSTNGVFLVRIFAVEGYTDVNGTIIAPAEIKIDFEFHNFPFINETSLLALQTKFQTNAVFKLKEETRGEDEGYAEKEDSVELESGSAVGYFAWAENASADGVEIEVLTSPMKLGASEKFMYLNYPHATHIVHDPKIGFVSEISAFYISGFPLVTVFSVIGIASLVLIIRKRKLN